MRRIIILFLFSFFLMFSCSDEKNQDNIENKETNKIEASNEVAIAGELDLLLLKTNTYVYNKIERELKGGDFNSAVFDIVWDKEHNTIYVNSIEIASIFPIIPFDHQETTNVESSLSDKDQENAVLYYGGEYNGELIKCKGEVGCGTVLFEHLKGIKCESICKVKTYYIYPFEPIFSGDYTEPIVLTKDKLSELVVSY